MSLTPITSGLSFSPLHRSRALWAGTVALALVLGIAAGIASTPPRVAEAACLTLPPAGFTWTIQNSAFETDPLGNPTQPLEWELWFGTHPPAIVKAKYEITEGTAVWYCAEVDMMGVVGNCQNPAGVGDNRPFPVGTFAAVIGAGTPASNCNGANADAPCVAEYDYVFNFATNAPLPTGGIGTLAQTYYIVKGTDIALQAHHVGHCDVGNPEFQFVNGGPIYGNPCSVPSGNLSSCYPVLYEP